MSYLWLVCDVLCTQTIETKMEQFKVCEKDTKTKAFSREGLARENRSDPREIEKEEKRNWANDCLDKLNEIVENIEGEVEKISNGRAKSKNKDQVGERSLIIRLVLIFVSLINCKIVSKRIAFTFQNWIRCVGGHVLPNWFL